MKKSILLSVLLLVLLSVSCNKDEITGAPEMETLEASEISIVSVTLSCKVIDEGDSKLTEIGLVVGTNPNPSIENSTKITFDLNKSTEYTTNFEDLPETATEYFVRAYGINAQGIGYGNEVSFTTVDNKICDRSVTLSSQRQVDLFGENKYNIISGSLLLEGNITNLSPLKDLVLIRENLEIHGTYLDDLKGLENLRRVSSNLKIYYTGIKSIKALKNMQIINPQSDIIIEKNEGLVNLDGLESVKLVNNISIVDNYWCIINFDGLKNVQANNIELIGNYNLNHFPHFENLSHLNNLTIIRSGILDFSGLEELQSIKNLIIRYGEITNFEGLKVSKITGLLSVQECDNLIDFSGLENLVSVGSFVVKRNPSLSSLNGLNNLNDSLSTLVIDTNHSLSDFCALTSFLNENNPYDGVWQIYWNAYNPSEEDIRNGNCSN